MPEPLGHFLLHGDAVPDDARVARYRVEERLSEPYRLSVDFDTTTATFALEDCMRERISLEVVDGRGGRRFFDGIVEEAELVDVVAERLHFRLVARPAMWALSRRKGSRIFQDKSIPAILQQLFEEAGFGDKVEWLLTKEYPAQTFVVQYRETELSFVDRRLEDLGLFYWFGHDADGHKLVIADDVGAFSSQDDTAETVFSMAAGVPGAEPLGVFSRRRRLRTDLVHVLDYDFEKPQAMPQAEQPGQDVRPAPYFEYPAGFSDGAAAQMVANARLRGLRADADQVTGQSTAIGLRCGVPFLVDGAAEPDLNGAFVVTELTTRGSQERDGGRKACENTFFGIPKDSPWAPPRRARRPRINGVQTAIVTGSTEQEQALHVDSYGRIKVRFYWDREGQQDHTSSCWIRTSQLPLGGSMVLPRIGWEVSVAFLDGDPDRPLVLGRVYNGEKPPPTGLPGAKASSTLKSWSSPGGGGFNEISLSDTAGSQGFSMHAQKDLNITIGHDKNETVAVDETHHISVNEDISIGSNESITIGGSQTLSVGANLTCNVGANQSITIGGNDTSNTTHDFVENVGANRAYTVGGNQITICNGVRHEIKSDIKKTVGSVQLNGSIASIKESVTGDYTHDAGAVTVHLVNGSHGESIEGDKNLTSMAAELHMTKANLEQSADGSVKNLIGGVHYQKLGGDLVIKAPVIAMLGAKGIFKGGGSELVLGGGAVVIKGKKINVKSAAIVKMGSSLKMG